MKNYELQLKHYEEMLELYSKDYKGYVAKIQDKYSPPQLPQLPEAPLPVEVERRMCWRRQNGGLSRAFSLAFSAERRRIHLTTKKTKVARSMFGRAASLSSGDG